MGTDLSAPRWASSLLTATLALVLGWYAFVEERRVPLLGMADLGVHELGHLLFMLGPDLLAAVMGNGLQTLLPLLVGAAFAIGRRDWPATGFCLAWAGTTLQDASVYIADAPYQALPLLFAGTTHDWAYILGPQQLDALGSAAVIASRVHDLGFVVLVAGFGTCLLPAVLRQLERNAQRVIDTGEALGRPSPSTAQIERQRAPDGTRLAISSTSPLPTFQRYRGDVGSNDDDAHDAPRQTAT